MTRRVFPHLCRFACETERKLDGPAKAGLFLLLFLLAAPTRGLAKPEQPPAAAGEPRAAETQATPERPAAGETPEKAEGVGAEDAEHEEGIVPVIARLVNFAILIGTLVYLLRSPLMAYLNDRGTQIRSDLVNAAEMKRTAAAQLEEIDRRMTA